MKAAGFVKNPEETEIQFNILMRLKDWKAVETALKAILEERGEHKGLDLRWDSPVCRLRRLLTDLIRGVGETSLVEFPKEKSK